MSKRRRKGTLYWDYLRCRTGWHDLYFGGLPPMWAKCRRCGWTR